MAWAATSKIGCGFVYYRNKKAATADDFNWYNTIIVCNYGVAGNDGTAMYKLGEPASDCGSNGKSDIAGLCN